MSALFALLRRRVCLNCIRHGISECQSSFLGLSRTQIRGKKQSTKKPGTINVRLLVDMKGYGRKGTITPVAPGRMRNSWYPRQHAEYLSTASDIDPRKVIAERDFSFGMQDMMEKKKPQSASGTSSLGTSARTKTKLLAPEDAIEALSELLPTHIIFYRTPIGGPERLTDAQQISPGRATSQAAQETYASLEQAPSATKLPDDVNSSLSPKLQYIYGSVSTLDIATSIKDILVQSEKGRRIVIGAEDIRILADANHGVEEFGEKRLKALGNFDIEVRVKGGDAVKRTVTVRAPETVA